MKLKVPHSKPNLKVHCVVLIGLIYNCYSYTCYIKVYVAFY